MATSSTASASHARFLRNLIERDRIKARQMDRDKLENVVIDPVLQNENFKYRQSLSRTSQAPSGNGYGNGASQASANQSYQHMSSGAHSYEQPYRYPHYMSSESGLMEQNRSHAMHMVNSTSYSAVDDFQYHRNIWRELGCPPQGFDPAYTGDIDFSGNFQSYLAFGKN